MTSLHKQMNGVFMKAYVKIQNILEDNTDQPTTHQCKQLYKHLFEHFS